MLSPFNPKFEKLVDSQLVRPSGSTTWYQLTYPDIAVGSASRVTCTFGRSRRPMCSRSTGLYYDYRFMSPEAIDRRRALMRKIVAQVRVEPPFGPPP